MNDATPVSPSEVDAISPDADAGTDTAASGEQTGHVCMVLAQQYPPDVRVSKEARALLSAGHEVTLCCLGAADEPARETVEGVEVVRIRRTNRRERALGLLDSAARLATGVRPRWEYRLGDLVSSVGADVIHVHDLPIAGTALRAGEASDVPVVLDLHENYPEAVRQWRRTADSALSDPRSALGNACFPVSRLKRLERRWVKRADHVLAVVEEARKHYLRDCGALPENVSVVSNTADLDAIAAAGVSPTEPFGDDSLTATYVGGFGEHRGLETAVAAMDRVAARVPDAELVLVGGSDDDRRDLRQRCARAGLDEVVTFTGWVEFEAALGHVADSDVCLVPHRRSPHTETTIPHKLFQYMALARPVAVTDLPPLERVVKDADAGRVVPPTDPEALAESLLDLYENPERAAALGANGRRAVEDRYNFSRDAATLRGVYRRVRRSA